MNAERAVRVIRPYLGLFLVLCVMVPKPGLCARWVEFHTESWSFDSDRLNRKLNFRNLYFYDSATLARTKNGDVTLWLKEVSYLDKYYVKKGEPTEETTFKRIKLRCSSRKYEILTGDGGEGDSSEAMSEEIKPGSIYDRLLPLVCRQKK